MARARAKRVGILTGGGDCPGLNAVIRPALRAAVGKGQLKRVPLESDVVRAARDMGIGFGD